jgi:hypothetical protein
MRFVGTSLVLASIALAVLALGGCGVSEPLTPTACFEGARAYEKALSDAPGEVRVNGETLISECFAERQPGGELAEVGEALVETATHLNAEAREEPGGRANLELGYLLGAAKAGSEATEGIHAELLRRLEVAARYAPGTQQLPPEFLETYRKGFDAGRSEG